MSKFRVASSRGDDTGTNTEASAITKAKALINNGNRYSGRVNEVGIYQLVKIVKRKETPVEVEEVSCCKPAPCSKAKSSK